jgi:GTP 3',8-cyclase
VHTRLRVSLTDRCDLRCRYCLPADVTWLPRAELLTLPELRRVVRVAVGLGITAVRLTGGEPLLRPDVVDVVAALRSDSPDLELSLTTNGTRLADLAAPLRAAGLDRVNVSLDTLRPATFTAITRRPDHDRVLAGIDAALAAGLHPVKVNAVLTRGVNDDEAPALLDWALARGVELRVIEAMPLDSGRAWDRTAMVTGDEVLAAWRSTHTLTERPSSTAAAREYDVDGTGRAGLVASVTAPFCDRCDRLRLTADGQLRSCLFARDESDLRGLLRSDATDSDLADRMHACVAGKQRGHGIGEPRFVQPERPMSAIGG